MIFRQDIQGLRALAVLAVMIFHYEPAWLPAGYIGVDVFLVISGYLITQILLAHKSAEHYRFTPTLWQFYIGRLRRIAPAYYALLLVVLPVAVLLFMPQDFNSVQASLEAALYFNSNQYFSSFGSYFSTTLSEQPLLHTWSLAVEMQFYLTFPLLLLLLPLNWLRWITPLLGILLLIISEYMLRINGKEQATYYAFYARVPEFLIGVSIALYGPGKQWSTQQANILWITGLLLLLSGALFIHGPFPGLLSLLPALGAGLLIAAGNSSSLARTLCTSPLLWVGALSYSLYLWHWPILAFMRYFTGEQRLDLLFTVGFIVLTLALSSASYYGIERRFHRSQTTERGRNTGLAWIILAPVLLWVGNAQATNANVLLSPPPLEVQYRRYADPKTICHSKIIGDCLRGDLHSQREILVLGDSHAAMLNLFFDEVGQEAGFTARLITASNCVTIPEMDVGRLPERNRAACHKQIDRARTYIQQASLIIVAGMWSYHTKSKTFVNALDSFLKNMHQQGKRVYLMLQVPQLNNNPLRTRRFQHLGLPAANTVNSLSAQANAKISTLAANYSNTKLLRVKTGKLFSNAPFYGGKLIYFDDHHLNEIGSKLYGWAAVNKFHSILTNVTP